MNVIYQQKNAEGFKYADTGITKGEWLHMLVAGIISQRQIETLLCFYREPEHQGTCNALAKKYGGHANSFNTDIWQLGRSVQAYLNRFEIKSLDSKDNNTEKQVFWCIPMIGKDSKQGFVWKVCPKLAEALEDYLYCNLVDVYKNRRRTKDLMEDDELYKWEFVNDCIDKNNLEIVNLCLSDRVNLLDWRAKDQLRKILQNQSEKCKPPIKDIYEASGAVATFASKAQIYDDKGRGRSGDSLLRREQD